MAEDTHIGWTDHTSNPWEGCQKKSPECKNCYIPKWLRGRLDNPFGGPQLTGEGTWLAPYGWNRKAREAGIRAKVFTCSLSDFFEAEADPWRPAMWKIIRECESLDWLILTKNADRIAAQLPPDWGSGYPNAWLGVTIGIESSMWRLPLLLDIPAVIRFVSAEPLLGPLSFRPYLTGGLHWVISGCESGAVHERRPMDLDWVRQLDHECRDAGVAHFFKQYYESGKLMKDGVLDGVQRQAWPTVNPQF